MKQILTFPQLINWCSCRLRSNIKQNTDYGGHSFVTKLANTVRKFCHTVRVYQGPKCVEKPAMTVELLLVLLLQAENNLYRTRSLWDLASLGNDNARSIPKMDCENPKLHYSEIAYSKIWAVTSFPATESFAMPSWYNPIYPIMISRNDWGWKDQRYQG